MFLLLLKELIFIFLFRGIYGQDDQTLNYDKLIENLESKIHDWSVPNIQFIVKLSSLRHIF